MNYKLTIVKSNNVDKEQLVKDLHCFADALMNCQNATFEYVTDSAIFKAEQVTEDSNKHVQFIDGACHMCCHH